MKAVFWSALIWWEPMGEYGLWTSETWGSTSTLAIMVLMEASTEGSVTRVPLVVWKTIRSWSPDCFGAADWRMSRAWDDSVWGSETLFE